MTLIRDLVLHALRSIAKAWRWLAPAHRGWWACIAGRGAMVIIALMLADATIRPVIGAVLHWASVRTVVVKVEDRWVKRNPDTGRDQYLVRLSGGETTIARVDDTWLWLRFDASNRYSLLTPGSTVKVRLAGMRLEFLSWYPNAINVERPSP